MFDLMDYGIVFFAALTAGFINTIAGGGTLISFPVLVALGIPPVQANMTNTITLCPGYFGGVWAQIKEFKPQKKRLLTILPFSVLGGITGGLLLVNSNEKFFNILVPFLILIASLLLAFQGSLKKWLIRRTEKEKIFQSGTIAVFILLFLASVYGGYFGAGVSVIVLAILGLIYDDSLTSLNVLKQAISFSINISAAIFFAFSGKIEWIIVLVMCAGSITGGFGGGRLAGKISPDKLRWTVVSMGILIAFVYFIRMIQII